MESTAIQQAFLEALPTSLRHTVLPTDLARAERLVTDTVDRWRQWDVPAHEFAAYLAARLPADKAVDVGLQRIHAEDLLLAMACVQGRNAALGVFESRILPAVAAVLARGELQHVMADDVRQQVRTLVLLGNEDGPELTKYEGRGELRSWLGLLTLRLARRMDKQRRRENEHLESVVDAAPALLKDAHTLAVQQSLGPVVKEAVIEALRSLEPQDARLLKLRFVDGLNLAEIGRIERVHKATICRRMAALQEHVLQATRARLQERLQLSESEVTSLLPVVMSNIQFNLSTVLT